MDLVDRIESSKFTGAEFLVWLWFESELFEGTLQLSDDTQCELWFESQLTLAREKEQAALKGTAPSANAEAHEALRQGKLPTRARMRIIRNELEYAFVLAAEDLSLSTLRIPAQLKTEADEQFYERMYLVEEIEGIVDGLFADFVTLRLGKSWDGFVLPALRQWVREGEVSDADEYGRKRTAALAKRKKK